MGDVRGHADLFLAELDTTNRRIDAHHGDYADARAHLDDALNLLANCAEVHARCDDANRRLCDQALFTKIYIDEDDRLRVEDNRPFEMLLAPEISAKRPYLGPRQQQGPNRNHRRWQGLRALCVGWS
jgi:hypothetical protein